MANFAYVPISLISLLTGTAACCKRVAVPALLADDLCGCMGQIDVNSNDRIFGEAVKHCMNEAVTKHPEEVISLMQGYRDQRQRAYLLGVLIGGITDRTCWEYPAVKERQRSLNGQCMVPSTRTWPHLR